MGIQEGVAAGAFVLGIMLAVMAGWSGNYWGASCFFFAGAGSGVVILLWEDATIEGRSGICLLLGAAAFGTGFMGVMTSSHVMNRDEAKAQQDLLDILTTAEIWSESLTDFEYALVRVGRVVCTLQQSNDMVAFVFDGAKSLYLTPGMTLIDGAMTAVQGASPKRCLDYYVELKKTQPDMFRRFERSHRWLVDQSQ